MPGRPRLLRVRILVVLLVIVALAAAAWGYWRIYLRGYVSTDDALVEGDEVEISSQISGRVAELGAGEGDTLRTGQLVVRLHDADLLAQQHQAEAAVEYARQSLGVAVVSLQRAEEDFERSKAQFQENVVPRENYDHARRAFDLARAQERQAEAQVANVEAQLDVIRTKLDDTRIAAPMNGVVARRWVLPGDVVQPGQPILTVFDLDSTWVTAHLEETKLHSIRIGDPTEISVDAFPGRPLKGEVARIGAATSSQFALIPPSNAAGNFTKVTQRVPVRIAIDRAPSRDGGVPTRLLPGMSVEVKIQTRKR